MGLSIHYSGILKNQDLRDQLVTETVDICESFNWTYQLIKEPNPHRLNGICFSPEECEPIFLTFLPDGRVCSPVNLMNQDIYEENGLVTESIYTTSTKTQFAGPDAHMAIIKLLRYLKEKYFAVFELMDEGMYWETLDKNVLFFQFKKYDFLLNTVADALSDMKPMAGETPLSLADRIEKMLSDRFGKAD